MESALYRGSVVHERLAPVPNRFEKRLHMRDLALPERFLRRWHFYLCYCGGDSHERMIGVAQLILENPRCLRDCAEGVLDG